MIVARLLILFTVTFWFSVSVPAQDSGFVYQDTSIVNIAAPESSDEEEDSLDRDVQFVPDTTLYANSLAIAPDSARALKNMKAFAYAKNLDSLLKDYQQRQKSVKAPSERAPSWLDRFFMSPLTRYFFWLLAIVFIGFILSKIFLTEGFFQRASARTPVRVLEDEPTSLSPDADYSRLISQALSQRNFRLAVRYHYLQSLQKLTTKELISFSPDKTNYEYIQELAGKPYKKDFAELTRAYEYAWYGAFELDELIFETIQHNFKKFNSVLA